MRRTLWVTAAVATAGVFVVARAADPTFAKVAETGDGAAGLPPTITYSAIQPPMVDASGTFLFESQLAGGSPGAGIVDSGVFLGHRGSLQLVARAGDLAPGAGGDVWGDLLGFGQVLRAGGRVVFPGELAAADATHDGGIWAGTVGNLALVAREGDPAPGTTLTYASSGRYFQGALRLAMNDGGAVAFRAKVAGQGVTAANDEALFAGVPGALSLVARVGSAAPDAGGATFFKSAGESFSPPSIDTSGKVLFRGHLTGAGVTPGNADAIWFGDPASPSIVVRGDQAVSGPGVPANSKLIGLGAASPVLNDAGQVLFEGSSFSDAFEFAQAVWLGPPGALVPIAVSNQPAPGDSQAATFTGLFQHLRMNASGQAAFHALLSSGGSDWGLFAWDGATLRELARTGDQALGMPIGETYDGTATEAVCINSAGKVLFRHTTTPSVIQGVWLADAKTGSVQLIARTDANVFVDVDGVPEKIIDLTLYGNSDAAGSPQDGRSSPLGDNGSYAILAQFLDGHVAVLTNGGPVAGSAGSVTPSTVSVGTVIAVKGSGFGGGADKFRAPTAWLTVEGSSKKMKLKVDTSTASDTEFHATVVKLSKGSGGPATLHVQPKVKGAAEIDAPVTIGFPHVDSLSAPSGVGGDLVTITGSHFGSKKRKVRFFATIGDRSVNKGVVVKSWSDEAIVVVVPKHLLGNGVTSAEGQFEVDNDAGESNTATFTVNG